MKLYSFSWIWIVLLCGASACSNQPKETLYANFLNEPTLCKGEILPKINTPLLVTEMVTSGSHIVVQSFNTEYFIYVIDPVTGQVINQFIPTGRGAGESLWVKNPVIVEGKLHLYDPSQKMVYIVQESDLFTPHPKMSIKEKVNEQEFQIISVVPLSGDHYLLSGAGGDPQAPFMVTDSLFNPMHSFGEFSIDAGSDADLSLLSLANQGIAATDPSGEHIVYASQGGSIIKFYDCKKGVKLQQEYLYDIPQVDSRVEQHFSTVIPKPETLLGTISIATGKRKCFLLHVSKSLQEVGSSLIGDDVLVFDWEGKPCERLKLDEAVKLIVYNESENALYGLSLDNATGESHFIKFQLK